MVHVPLALPFLFLFLLLRGYLLFNAIQFNDSPFLLCCHLSLTVQVLLWKILRILHSLANSFAEAFASSIAAS